MSPDARPSRRWPLGLLGAVAAVALGEASVARRAADLTHPNVLEWGATRRAAGGQAAGNQFLCVGSSLVKFGVLPAVIEAKTGLRGFNLAVPGGSPPVSYFLLKRALDRGARPSAVVVEYASLRLAPDPCPPEAVAPLSQALGPADILDLSWQLGDASYGGRLLAAWVLPSVRMRHEVRNAVVGALAGHPFWLRHEVVTYDRNRARNRGALVYAKDPSFRPPDPPGSAPDESAAWRCHPVN